MLKQAAARPLHRERTCHTRPAWCPDARLQPGTVWGSLPGPSCPILTAWPTLPELTQYPDSASACCEPELSRHPVSTLQPLCVYTAAPVCPPRSPSVCVYTACACRCLSTALCACAVTTGCCCHGSQHAARWHSRRSLLPPPVTLSSPPLPLCVHGGLSRPPLVPVPSPGPSSHLRFRSLTANQGAGTGGPSQSACCCQHFCPS